MTSNIDPSKVDITYPVGGQTNPSSGFRENFSAIRENFKITKTEIDGIFGEIATLDQNFQISITPVVIGEDEPSATCRSFFWWKESTRELRLWNNIDEVWRVIDDTRLSLDGGEMNGFITLHSDPTDNLHAATKQYVDSGINIVSNNLSNLASSADSTYVKKSGDTMTGNLNWGITERGLNWAMNTDGASIIFYNTGDGDTDSRLEFNTRDNNNEYFRWTHTPTGVAYECMRLMPNSNGNSVLTVNGKVNAAGGTMSDFLTLHSSPIQNLHAATKQYVDAVSSPSGAVMYFASPVAPVGWLKANGAAISRTTYAALFAAIGTTYGAGNGSTTFNLPDLRGEFIRGWDEGRGVDLNRAFATVQSDEFKNHQHEFGADDQVFPNGYTLLGNFEYDATSRRSGGGVRLRTRNDSTNFGGTETRPRNIALLACIKF
jgi:hypothetical protein